jgi:hypothetical protein
MTFAHPWLLLGTLAALIPLLVHLFDRRRPRPLPFAALTFVLRSQRRTASRLKLRRLLLYALRTFLLLAFPIALARPEWKRPAQAATVQHGPAATAILLDASLSMRYRDTETLFERGRAEVRAALSSLQAGEPAVLFVCGTETRPRGAPQVDRTAFLSELDSAQPTYGSVDMSRCMEAAARSLAESPLPAKRLVLVSSFTRRGFADLGLKGESQVPSVTGPLGRPERPEVVLRDVANGKSALPNYSLSNLRVEAAPQAGARAYQFTFSIRNLTAQPLHDLTVQLKQGETVLSRGFVDAPVGGTVEKVFTHRFETGGTVVGEVALPEDGLAEDDHLPFVLQIPTETKALLVNGAPSPVRQKDEAFFAEAALRAAGSPVTLTVRDSEAAWREDFSQNALILLLNVEAPPPDVALRLQRFVENGGGLFIALGDHVQPDAYNSRLGALLPRPLHVLKSAASAAETAGDVDEAAVNHLGEVDDRHPLFALFTGSAQEGLRSARFSRHFLLQPEARSGAETQVLAAFDDGSPALVETRRGKGRVALWTSTLDRDWTDLPIRTSFLPLLQRLCAQLTGALEEHDSLRAQVGERALLPAAVPPPTQVRTPNGALLSLETDASRALRTPPLAMPGAYTVLDAGGQPIPSLAFAATLNPSDSDLARLDPATLSHNWGQRVTVASTQTAEHAPLPLWTWLLVAATLAFFGEGLLLRKSQG